MVPALKIITSKCRDDLHITQLRPQGHALNGLSNMMGVGERNEISSRLQEESNIGIEQRDGQDVTEAEIRMSLWSWWWKETRTKQP